MQLRRLIDRLFRRAPAKSAGRSVTRYMFVDEVDRYGPGDFAWRPRADREVADVDILARTHVERSEHFVVQRFGA